jgi:hypothetical protein
MSVRRCGSLARPPSVFKQCLPTMRLPSTL